MRKIKSTFLVPVLFPAIILSLVSCGQQQGGSREDGSTALKKGVILVDYREKRKVDVYIDGDIFTSYIYPENLEKPVLYPVRAANGTEVTRGFPIDPREGERVDHPHQAGVWFTFGDVNGYDFWANSYATKAEDKSRKGRVLHRGVKRAESREALGVLEIAADWQVPSEDGWFTVLQENTVFEFSGDESTRTIDRITRLTAQEDEVIFGDNKEGLFGIRVSREFEHPSDEPAIFTDAEGNPEDLERIDNASAKGNYINSEGIEGTDTWGQPASWICLRTSVTDEDLSVSIFDHPSNIGFPSRWMARGYGLLSVNNLGVKVFDENAEPSLVKLLPGESVVFRHRIHISSGFHPTGKQLEELFEDFSGK